MLRFERKYRVPYEQLQELRNQILPFVRPDYFASNVSGIPEYTVRSIYFDTIKLNAIHEKVDGLESRRKLRIRSYDKPSPSSLVFLEIKKKIGEKIGKNRSSFF